METAIFHIGNVGLFFYRNGTGILTDGIYDGSKVGMSAMPEAWMADLKQCRGILQQVDGLLFTHLHPDHYQEQLTAAYCSQMAERGRQLTVYAPDWEASHAEVHDLGEDMCRIHIKNAEIITRRTIHDGGEPWKNDPHETFLVKMGNEAFFVSGDGVLSVEDATAFHRYAYHIDIAFVNLYQLGSESGMECIHALDADRIVLYHLPAQEDDTCHYWMIGMQAVERFTGTYGEEVEIAEHMAWIDAQVERT